MKNGLSIPHILLPFFFVPVCLFLFIHFGWAAFATFTNRPGLTGDMHFYYRLTRFQFFVYNSAVALAALPLCFLQVKYLMKKDVRALTKTLYAFLIFTALLVVAEICLATAFVGKG